MFVQTGVVFLPFHVRVKNGRHYSNFEKKNLKGDRLIVTSRHICEYSRQMSFCSIFTPFYNFLAISMAVRPFSNSPLPLESESGTKLQV